MILPAVAVRRAREKRKSSVGFTLPPKHRQRIAFLYQNRVFIKRVSNQSVTSIRTSGSDSESLRRSSSAYKESQGQNRGSRYQSLIFLITGFLLMLIGVGLTMFTSVWEAGSIAQTVGLLFTGTGVVLCAIQVFESEGHGGAVYTRIRRMVTYLVKKVILLIGLVLVLIGGGLSIFVKFWKAAVITQSTGLLLTGVGIIFHAIQMFCFRFRSKVSKAIALQGMESGFSAGDMDVDSDKVSTEKNPDFAIIPNQQEPPTQGEKNPNFAIIPNQQEPPTQGD